MSELTPELNLVKGVDADDTADYLTIGLADSLNIIDGLFNSTTGHAHNGSHQGGQLEFLDLEVGEDLLVHGTLTVEGTSHLQSTLHVIGAATLDSTLNVAGLATFSGGITTGAGALTVGNTQINGTLGVTGTTTLTNTNVNGTLGVGGTVNLPGGASLTGTRYTMQGGASVLVSGTDVVRLLNHATIDYDLTVGRTLVVTGGGQVNGSLNVNSTINAGSTLSNPWFNAGPGAIILGNTSTVNWNSAGVGGRPTYVLGQGGDGFLHWYNSNTIGPPASVLDFVGTVNATSQGTGATTTLSYTTSHNDLPATNNGTSVTVGRTGQYHVSLICIWANTSGNTNDTVTLRLRNNGADIVTDSHVAPTQGTPGRWTCTYRGMLNSGDQLSAVISNQFDNANLGGGESQLVITFVPTQDYNGS